MVSVAKLPLPVTNVADDFLISYAYRTRTSM